MIIAGKKIDAHKKEPVRPPMIFAGKPPVREQEKRKPKIPLDILICTPDVLSDVTQRCLKSLAETTAHIEYNLTIYDNRGRVPFVHAKCINRMLDQVKGNLVICDDDITFSDGWLDAALDIAESQEDVGIVAFHLENMAGEVWGSAMWSGLDGLTARCFERFKDPCCIPSQCSACWLIAPSELRFDEDYNKYRFEHVFALRTWEEGRKVWSVPKTIYHECCTQFRATVKDDALRLKMCKADEAKYQREWIETGREWDILEKVTPYMPDAIVRDKEFNHERKQVNIKPEVKPASERRALVTVAVGDQFKVALQLFERYANKCRADFFCIDEKWQGSESSAHYLKWRCNAIMDMGYTRIAFIDADCVIMPDAPDIFDAVKPGTLGVFDEAPIMMKRRLDRKRTCDRFVASWRRQIGDIEYQYPGYYFNSGVMVFDRETNPLITRADGVYSFNTDTVFDQTYLNVVSAQFPKTMLDWKWNRMAINQAHEYIGSEDMFYEHPYIMHYCGNPDQKARINEDLLQVMPAAVERLPGPSLDGIRDFWRAVGDVKNAVEVGSAHGESAWEATSLHPDMKLVCVDPWEGKRYGEIAKKDFDIRHGWNRNVSTLRTKSTDAASKIKDNSLDLVYLDAMHEDPWITQDVAAWLPKVKKGGIIGGHDYNTKLWPDVVAAVNESFGGPDMVFQDTSWLVRKNT